MWFVAGKVLLDEFLVAVNAEKAATERQARQKKREENHLRSRAYGLGVRASTLRP